MEHKYKFLEHPAELKICSWGKDLPELFINSALGMMSYIYDVLPAETTNIDRIEVRSQSMESLLVDWLSEILCLSDTKKQAYTHFRIFEFSANQISAEIASAPAKAQDDIKAVTYHELALTKKTADWEAIVVYDI